MEGRGAGEPPRDAGLSDEIAAQRAQARGEAFAYTCNRCKLCCQGKLIQVNPYEIARLARLKGVSTSEFTERWTEDGAGMRLARDETDTCVFLGPEGCGVHPDRPLVCRVYPLGRHVAPSGTERWSHVNPHPQTKGVYGKDGTIADYLAGQDAALFMRAADDYTAWIRRAYEVVGYEEADGSEGVDPGALLDMDGAIAAHCKATGTEEPLDIEARKALHLRILATWLDEFVGGSS